MKYLRLWVAAAAFFVVGAASAQQAGTVTSHAFAVGKGAGKSSFTSILCTSAQIALGQSAADPICQTLTGDVTINASGVTAIGASKVTNAQIATMLANTTKCNATGSTTNPTDCSASTMKTNLGLVIGTNVEAWDSDLDCLAALSSTGVIKRTGSGTCSAGTIALSDLAAGTQDTIIGYFGSTAASALAINNCANALTYSTSTHTFGCNSSAGTGTVTGPGSSVSGNLPSFNGTSGIALQDSGIPAANLPVLLATVSGSGVSTLGDTTHITSTYPMYEIVFEDIIPATNSTTIELLVHSGGIFQTSNYVAKLVAPNGTAITNTNNTTIIALTGTDTSNSIGFSGRIRVYNPSTSSIHQWEGSGAYWNGASIPVQFSGVWNTSAVIDGVEIAALTGNISGKFKIYGYP